MEFVWGISLAVFGAALGSFAGAQVWRLRARQLQADNQRLTDLRKTKKRSQIEALEYSELKRSHKQRQQQLAPLKPLLDETLSSDRSRCLACQHQLTARDLIPIVSWLSTGGRCRYCGQSIGRFELLIELGLAIFFVLSWLLWPMPIDGMLSAILLIVWLVASVPLAILFAYDAKWYLLPDVPMITFIGSASIFAALSLVNVGLTEASLWSLLGAIAAIGGLYGLLYVLSRGRWVGYGDVTLGAGLGLLVGRWQLALMAVFLANMIGSLLVLPGLITGKLDRKGHIPFGPLLITGAVLAFFIGQSVIDWYFKLLI